jgi:hypothetical protein
MNPIVILTRAQVDLYCNGLVDLVWEPPRANACAHDEARDMLDQFKVAKWHTGALGAASPNEAIVRGLAEQLAPKVDAWFDPQLWAEVVHDVEASRTTILDMIESLRQAALENLSH